MSSNTMLDRLDWYYREQGISAKDFKCKHVKACQSVCKSGEMVSLPAAYVGPEYEKGTLPRLLFVSSDTNDASWVKMMGTGWGSLEDEREVNLKDHRSPRANTHWGQTLDLAVKLLSQYSKGRLNKDICCDKIIEYIAHTRSVKCKDSTIGAKEGHPKMLSNCRGILVGEVKAMQPEIIVVQGARARSSLAGAFPVIRKVAMPGYPNTYYQIVQFDSDHTAIMIIAKHPCARGRNGWKRGEKKRFTDWASKSVQEVLPVA
jgi:hypothetical protein